MSLYFPENYSNIPGNTENTEKVENIQQTIVDEIVSDNTIDTVKYDGSKNITQLNLTELLYSDLLKIHAYARDNNIEITNLLHIEVAGIDADIININYETLTINFTSPISSDFTLNIWIDVLFYKL